MQHPTRVGKYEVEQFLGGGMAHVYRAKDTVLGRRVALKLLTEASMADPEAKARFLQEARLASNIQHENIIRIFDFGEEDLGDGKSRPFLVMEYVEGESLRRAIENGRAGDIGNRLRIAAQAARALDYIHARKVVHRDIKPENIHIDTAGKARLMDFGIANATGAPSVDGKTAGTPYYMAPEQVLGRPLTAQADIYSFGIVLYELFTGAKPFMADSVEKIFELILYQPVDRGALVAAHVPASVCDLIGRCTSKKLMERPLELNSVGEELASAAAIEPAAPRPVDTVAPGLLSPSSQRAPSEMRLKMPPPPPPAAQTSAPKAQTNRILLVVAASLVVAAVIYGMVALLSAK
ncbi:MAG: serine/threonine-protein kinase [Acidobacteriota bacterium]